MSARPDPSDSADAIFSLDFFTLIKILISGMYWGNLKNGFLGVILLIVGVMPVAYYGVTNSPPPWIPNEILRFSNISRLFPNEEQFWIIHVGEFSLEGEKKYRIIDENEFFAQQPYGFRSRFQRVFDLADLSTMELLADWIHHRISLKYTSRRVERIRFLRIEMRTNLTTRPLTQHKQSGMLADSAFKKETVFSKTYLMP